MNRFRKFLPLVLLLLAPRLAGAQVTSQPPPSALWPEEGIVTYDLTPAFGWTAVTGAATYEFDLSESPSFSPLRVFLPASFLCFLGAGADYVYWWMAHEAPELKNGAQLLSVLGALLFFLGLISEQIASLRFDRSEES